MKKIFLIAFAVIMFSTPCPAQIETNSLISINNTLWVAKDDPIDFYLGFSGGNVYGCVLGFCIPYPDPFYIDFLLLSLCSFKSFDSDKMITVTGFLLPALRIGIIFWPKGDILIFVKDSDNWTP